MKLSNRYLTFHKVVILTVNYNFENRLIFDEVRAYKRLCQFSGPPCVNPTEQISDRFPRHILTKFHYIMTSLTENDYYPGPGIVSNQHELWSTNSLKVKIEPAFLHALRKFCFLFHYQASQTEISK